MNKEFEKKKEEKERIHPMRQPKISPKSEI